MKPNEFIQRGLKLRSRIDAKKESIRDVLLSIEDLQATEHRLCTQHLDDLTTLRPGSVISLATLDPAGYYDWNLPFAVATVAEVQSATILRMRTDDMPVFMVYALLRLARLPYWHQQFLLDPLPGRMWRFYGVQPVTPASGLLLTASNETEAV